MEMIRTGVIALGIGTSGLILRTAGMESLGCLSAQFACLSVLTVSLICFTLTFYRVVFTRRTAPLPRRAVAPALRLAHN
jgi:hypothetical protein